MPLNKPVQVNEFELILTTIMGHEPQVILDLTDEKIIEAIQKHDTSLFVALEVLIQDYQEIKAVMIAEEFREESIYRDSIDKLQGILNSKYASEELKKFIMECGLIMPQTKQSRLYLSRESKEHEQPNQQESVFKVEKKSSEGNIYLMANSRNRYTKIGFTMNKPEFRERTLQSEEPEISLKCWFKGLPEDEIQLHRLFQHKRMRGEWFDLSKEDIDVIKSYFTSINS